jgi:hypothetical protein
VALVTALLVVMLMSAMMAGMFAALTSDQRSHAVDRDQSQAYAAAHAGLEKLTTSLAQLFEGDVSPSTAQISATDDTPPVISGFSFTAPGGAVGSGYAASFTDVLPAGGDGNPDPSPSNDITTGPFAGLKGLITPYILTVTARSNGTGGSEVRLRRELQTVAVPVFQFGVFGDGNLSFHSGSNFNFGGRVHTNQHLFLASGGGFTLTFADKVTAVGQVVRQQLENTYPIASSGHTGTVMVPTVIGSPAFDRALTASEGSVTSGIGSAAYGSWKSLSEDTYHTNIRTTLTGARRLDLPLVSQGAFPIDLIRRPALGAIANPLIHQQRYYAQASVRILLSDRAADITGLPTVTATAPIALDGDWIGAPPAGYTGARPLARSVGSITMSVTAGTYAGARHQLTVAAITYPAAYKVPPSITMGALANVICSGRTISSFTGCSRAAGGTVNNGVVVSAAGIGPTTTTSLGASVLLPVAASPGVTIAVTANGAIPFSLPSPTFWLADNAPSNFIRPVTCTGYSDGAAPKQLLDCAIAGWATPFAAPIRNIATYALQDADQSLLGGFIKIEKNSSTNPAAPNWTDVTLEILNLGFAADRQEGSPCGDPTPNAVIRIQRLRDNGGACSYPNSVSARDYWPNVGLTDPMRLGGVMNYISLDVGNLARWFNGTIGATGNLSANNNGFIVYFSDRRGNHDDTLFGQPETGEYGNEDSINTAQGVASDAPNAVLEDGENRNESMVGVVPSMQTYGAVASTVAGVMPAGFLDPYDVGATPRDQLASHPMARVNRQILFRRALKLVNGGIVGGVNSLPVTGLTVAAENPVYVQGNYNAISTDANVEPNRPAAIIADAVTILSNAWLDVRSLNNPNDYTQRDATTTGYRFALIAGRSIAFARPVWATISNWGTDGGVHNFMRMLEDWGNSVPSQTAHYRGSIVSLYTARQAIGIFKNNSNVYFQPTRNFAFDTDFLTPSLLPPGTPMFRDINTLKFRQILRPNQ